MSSSSRKKSNINPNVVDKVIGDVVDKFVASVMMDVYYDIKHITNGCDVKPSIAALPPRVVIGGEPNHLYTLVMTDPDAPSPSDPYFKEWLHWIVTDIPGCSDATQGNVIVEYMAPKPVVGIHRYILVLYKQKAAIGVLEPPMTTRANFNTRSFATYLALQPPVATVYFNAHKEPSPASTTRRRNSAVDAAITETATTT